MITNIVWCKSGSGWMRKLVLFRWNGLSLVIANWKQKKRVF